MRLIIILVALLFLGSIALTLATFWPEISGPSEEKPLQTQPKQIQNKPLSDNTTAPTSPKEPFDPAKRDTYTQRDGADFILAAERAYYDAASEDPKSQFTIAKLLDLCKARAQFDHPAQVDCFNRFFDLAGEVEIDPVLNLTAYRWRTMMAVKHKNKRDANFYLEQLLELEPPMLLRGKVSTPMQAWTQYIRALTLDMNGQYNEALKAIAFSIELYDASGEKDPGIYYDNYLQKADIYDHMQKPGEAVKVRFELVTILEQTLGQIHPDIAMVRLLNIKSLLANGDKEKARSEWDYVNNVIGRIFPKKLPPEINKIFGELIVLLDMNQLNP